MADHKGSEKAGRKRVLEEIAEQEFPKRPRLAAKTDPARWRMKNEDGRHTWHYLADDKAAREWPQNYADKWYLGLPLASSMVLPPQSLVASGV
jgi:lanosterol synthase